MIKQCESSINNISCKLEWGHECRGSNFNVAKDTYYTAIRCTHCMWEVCIHEG